MPVVSGGRVSVQTGSAGRLDADPAGAIRRSPRDRLADALLFLLALALTMFVLLDGVVRHVAPAPLSTDLVLGVASSAGVWLRRRWPAELAILISLFSLYSASAAAVGLIALFTVAAYRRFAVAAPIAAGYVAASLLMPLIRADQPGSFWTYIVPVVLCSAAVLAWGMFVRARRQLARARLEQVRHAESERELQLDRARQLERTRIAREMHDVLAHRLSLLSLDAGALEMRPDAPPDQIARSAIVIRESAHQALEDLRQVIGVLRAGQDGQPDGGTGPDRPQATLADLPELAEESRHVGTPVRLTCQVPDPAEVPAALARSTYRIVQEGLTNARKHAPGAEVTLTVRGRPGEGLTIEASNPCPAGASGPPGSSGIPGAGTGIIGLSERVSLAGGHLEHGPASSGDFRLRAWLPWPA